uniref:Zinc finger, CCHC-type, retrotransposon Gag domain protein n=1 Tax=Tanacetum cinerariifolium TaxID=118510 RepID=A0A6L2MBR9_TANCI|nr:zinc finger, CCHC-type, retrotransposon Gag domain protein [Tanacetum cinerariifolium]
MGSRNQLSLQRGMSLRGISLTGMIGGGSPEGENSALGIRKITQRLSIGYSHVQLGVRVSISRREIPSFVNRRLMASVYGGLSPSEFLSTLPPSLFGASSNSTTLSLCLRTLEDFIYRSGREIEGKGSKQTPAKNPDAPVTKGELGNEIKRIMSEHLPSILAQSQENFKKAEEARKAIEEPEKRKKANEEAKRRRTEVEDKRAAYEQERKRKAEQDRKYT